MGREEGLKSWWLNLPEMRAARKTGLRLEGANEEAPRVPATRLAC